MPPPIRGSAMSEMNLTSAVSDESFSRRVIRDTIRRRGAQFGLCWVVIVAVSGVFAPFLANSHPYWMVVAGEGSSPLIAHLAWADVALLATFAAAVAVWFLRDRLSGLGREDLDRALPYPSANRWILDQVALWLTLGHIPGLTYGDFSPRDVLQNGEFQYRKLEQSGWVLCHYYTQNMDLSVDLQNEDSGKGLEETLGFEPRSGGLFLETMCFNRP